MIRTYRELYNLLATFTDDQLNQTVQVCPPHSDGDKPIKLLPVFAIGTMQHMLSCHDEDGNVTDEPDQEARSADDGKNHLEQIALFADGHGWSDHGDCAYEMMKGPNGELLFKGCQSGKYFDMDDREVDMPEVEDEDDDDDHESI